MIEIIVGCTAIGLTLILVVGLHELGHYFAARCFGVGVKQFSIGFGKPLFSWENKKGVRWNWRWLPLGGYVELMNSRIDCVSQKLWPYCLDRKSANERIIIYLAGIFMNFLVALMAFSLMFFIGIKQTTPTLKKVERGSIAAQARLRGQDMIIRVDGKVCRTWREFVMGILQYGGTRVALPVVVKRQDKLISMALDLGNWRFKHNSGNVLASLGIIPEKNHESEFKRWNLMTSISMAGDAIVYYSLFFCIIVKQLIVGNIPFMALLGPLGMLKLTVDFFAQGVSAFLNFIALFSIAVGLVNSIPLPGLDGGAVLYVFVERLRKRPMTVALETLLLRLSYIVLAVFFVQLLMNDLNRYFSG